MEPSSASRSWAKSQNAISTDSSPRFAPRSAEQAANDAAAIPAAPDSGADTDDVSGVHVPTAVVDSIIESTVDPANRFYRYPAARALLPILGRIKWLTPNHVTYAHIACGVGASLLVALTRESYWLVVAFVLCEVRMILDCFDGVLARARGSSSPFGRALDEIADSIAFVTLTIAFTHRIHLGAVGVLLACLTLIFGGLSANAWDFYKRKITSALRDSHDGVLEEIRSKKTLIESGKGTFLGYWGVYFDCFQVLLYEVRPASKKDSAVGVIRARAADPQFRRFAGLLAFLSFDNGLGILHFGVLTGLFLQSQLFALGYAVFMWLSTMIFARIVLRSMPAQQRVAAES